MPPPSSTPTEPEQEPRDSSAYIRRVSCVAVAVVAVAIAVAVSLGVVGAGSWTQASLEGGVVVSAAPAAASPNATGPQERELTGEYTVVRSFYHDTGAFTQGLVVWDGMLLESTGLYGQSTLRELDRTSGQVIRRISLPNNVFGEGLAVLPGGLAKVLTWKAQEVLWYNATTFASLGRQPLTSSTTGEGWGLAAAAGGRELLVSDGSAVITRADAQTMAPLSRVTVLDGSGRPVPRLNELELVLDELLANVWFQSFLVRIDPETGRQRGRIDLSSLSAPPPDGNNVLNGVACDDTTARDAQGVLCYVTGKQWPRMYELRLHTRPRGTAG